MTEPRCGCCLTDAERLLTLAEVLSDRSTVIIAVPPVGDAGLATAALALELARRRPLVKLRAMAEGWDRRRIVREMY